MPKVKRRKAREGKGEGEGKSWMDIAAPIPDKPKRQRVPRLSRKAPRITPKMPRLR